MTDTAALVAFILAVLIPCFLIAAVLIKTHRDGSLAEDIEYMRYVARANSARRKYNRIRNH